LAVEFQNTGEEEEVDWAVGSYDCVCLVCLGNVAKILFKVEE